ncbi:MAG: hypothetical protein ISS81_10735 [Candidatus Marinimicrobia bacterium]|nr:hypothetical protein [Candidatus Neomarinimicrobiota bacterium]
MIIKTKIIMSLRNMPLFIKIGFLIIVASLFYISPLFVTESLMKPYFFILLFIVVLFASFCRIIIGKKLFKSIFWLWFIGAAIYLLISTIRIYNMSSLSPYQEYNHIFERWLYVVAHSIRLLGTFAVGLIFIKVTSPIEFLNWGKPGLYFALLLRATQYSTEKFNEVRIALLMQNKWPDDNGRIIQPKNAWLTIKYAPALVAVTFRNIIQWFPWAWIFFTKLHNKLKGVKT